MLSKFKLDMAPVTERDRAITEFLQHDMCEDMSIVACGVGCEDVVETFERSDT